MIIIICKLPVCVCVCVACVYYLSRERLVCVLLAAATERPANKLQCHSKLTTIKHKRARETACLNSNNMIYCVLMQNNHNSNNITHAAPLCWWWCGGRRGHTNTVSARAIKLFAHDASSLMSALFVLNYHARDCVCLCWWSSRSFCIRFSPPQQRIQNEMQNGARKITLCFFICFSHCHSVFVLVLVFKSTELFSAHICTPPCCTQQHQRESAD